MDDRLDALERRMSSLEDKLRQMMVEFRQSMLSEFAKFKDRMSPNKTVGKFILKMPDTEQCKGTSYEKLKEGGNVADSWSPKTTDNVVPTPELSNPKLHAASLEIQDAESEELENDDDDLDGVAESDEESKDVNVEADSGLPRSFTPSELNQSSMGLAMVEVEKNQAAAVEPPPPPKPPDLDPFMAVTKVPEVASKIEIEEEKEIKGNGSGNLGGSKPRGHKSWVSRDPIGSNYPKRPGFLGSGLLTACLVAVEKERNGHR